MRTVAEHLPQMAAREGTTTATNERNFMTRLLVVKDIIYM